MTWPGEVSRLWWVDISPIAELVPWTDNIEMPVTRAGNFDYDEVACMREQVWAMKEGLV